MKRFGALLDNLKVREKFNVYPLLFFLRRMILVIITVPATYPKSMKMLTLFFTNFLVLLFVGMHKIFKEKQLLKLVLFNETMIFHLTIQLSLLTDLCPDPLTQYQLSWLAICEVLVFLVVNMALVAFPILSFFYRRARIYLMIWNNRILRQKLKKQNQDDEIEVVDEFEPQSQAQVEKTRLEEYISCREEELQGL